MNILIIGSEGFIGGHLVTHFCNSCTVYGIDLVPLPTQLYTYWQNTKNDKVLESAFRDNHFDICINAAGNGNVAYSFEHPDYDFELNVSQTHGLLEVLRKYQPHCAYLHLSSAAVYGNPKALPISETNTINPLSPYGWHKYLAEILCKEYQATFSLKIAILRPFSIYGPGLKKQIFWDLFQKYRLDSSQIDIWGTGDESRDFIFIKDFCKCVQIVIEKGEFEGSVYNIGVGEEMKISRAVEIFFSNLNSGIKIKFDNQTKTSNPLNWRADISKISKLGFAPEYSFEDGIFQVTKWIQSQN